MLHRLFENMIMQILLVKKYIFSASKMIGEGRQPQLIFVLNNYINFILPHVSAYVQKTIFN